MVARGGMTFGQEWEVLQVQLVLDAVLHDVLYNRRPAGHLVRLISDALLPRNLVHFLPVTLQQLFF